MKTDDFIRELAAAAPSPAPRRSSLVLYGVTGLMLAAAAFIAIGGVRPDLGGAWLSTGLKIAFGALAALAMLPLMIQSTRPTLRITGVAAWPLLVLAAAAGVSIAGLVMTAAPLRWTLWTSGGVPACLWQIPLIAIPTGAALMLAVRRFAPTRLGVAGLAIGAVAGALAAIPYSLFCPVDFAPYVATWYTAAFMICAALGAIVGARFLRW